MMRRVAHVVMEAVIGLAALAAVAACLLVWRLAQGPIDITPLLPMLLSKAPVRAERAALAWEGFDRSDQPVDLRLRDVASTGRGTVHVHIAEARITLSLRALLLGRVAPRSLIISGAQVVIDRQPPPVAHPAGNAGTQPAAVTQGGGRQDWASLLSELRQVDIAGSSITLAGAAPGFDLHATGLALTLTRATAGALTGTAAAHMDIGGITSDVAVRASQAGSGTSVVLTTTSVSPAAIARLSPAWQDAAILDLPVAITAELGLDASLHPQSLRAGIEGDAGRVTVGTASVGIAALNASLVAHPDGVALQSMRIAFAQAPGTTEPPPVATLSAHASLVQGQIEIQFNVRVPSLQLGDLGKYWPAGTGGGSRTWIVQNLTSGHAHEAHVTGTLMMPLTFASVDLTSLAGGMTADDVTLYWLKPVPPLTHAHAVVKIEGPDALKVTMDDAAQDRLRLLPGSFVHFNGLAGHHQFADIDARIAGPLTDTLHLLAHPRLNLLSRSGLTFDDPAGEVAAHLTLHMPLEDRLTMEQIAIAATADLTGVHLGRVAAGYDLDGATLGLRIDTDGLSLTGTGRVGGIFTALGAKMDFRAGPPDQVVQHVTARGSATRGQLEAAGLPPLGLAIIAQGSTGLDISYDAMRDGSAMLGVDADFTADALTTKLGWLKPAGAAASARVQIRLDHGRLAGIDQLRAQGPRLAISGHAVMTPHARTLMLERAEIGASSAHGSLRFPIGGTGPLGIVLRGSVLDLRATLAKPAKPAPDAPPDDTPGPPWEADIVFDRVLLTQTDELAPFRANAASNGVYLLHADIAGGARDALALRITPQPGGRALSGAVSNAGLMLRALDVADNLEGGTLRLSGQYDDTAPGHILSGTADMANFTLRDAPAFGRLLQAMTLYGLSDVLRGPGLHFSRLIAPFTWERHVLTLHNARAFSPSLGITAQGSIDLRRHVADVQGTLVPAYFFNQLLGDIPIFGQIFSPEKGGGVFAARYSVRGKLSDPQVGVNPLAALTPGFLREGFGIIR